MIAGHGSRPDTRALLVVAGGAAAWFLSSRAHPKDDEAAEEPAPAKEAAKTPPTFLPMDNMVVNLADPGGERFAQIGITLEVVDAKTADQVKQYLPSIRSGVLMVISQRTSGELLQREGKEKLANDILREVSKPLGFSVPVAKKRVVAEGEELALERAFGEVVVAFHHHRVVALGDHHAFPAGLHAAALICSFPCRAAAPK